MLLAYIIQPGEASRCSVLVQLHVQVEFYFSDANLPTDKHLLKQIQKDAEGYGEQ
jgi:hypothetical protein